MVQPRTVHLRKDIKWSSALHRTAIQAVMVRWLIPLVFDIRTQINEWFQLTLHVHIHSHVRVRSVNGEASTRLAMPVCVSISATFKCELETSVALGSMLTITRRFLGTLTGTCVNTRLVSPIPYLPLTISSSVRGWESFGWRFAQKILAISFLLLSVRVYMDVFPWIFSLQRCAHVPLCVSTCVWVNSISGGQCLGDCLSACLPAPFVRFEAKQMSDWGKYWIASKCIVVYQSVQNDKSTKQSTNRLTNQTTNQPATLPLNKPTNQTAIEP